MLFFERFPLLAEAESDAGGGGAPTAESTGSGSSAAAASNFTEGRNDGSSPSVTVESSDPVVKEFFKRVDFSRIDASHKQSPSPGSDSQSPSSPGINFTDLSREPENLSGRNQKLNGNVPPAEKPKSPVDRDEYSAEAVDGDESDEDLIRLAVELGVPEARARNIPADSLDTVLTALLSTRFPNASASDSGSSVTPEARSANQSAETSAANAGKAKADPATPKLSEARRRLIDQHGWGEADLDELTKVFRDEVVEPLRAEHQSLREQVMARDEEIARLQREQWEREKVTLDSMLDEVCPRELFGTFHEHTKEQAENANALARRAVDISRQAGRPITPALLRVAMNELFGPQLANINAGKRTQGVQKQSRGRMGAVTSGSRPGKYTGPPHLDPRLIAKIRGYHQSNEGTR